MTYPTLNLYTCEHLGNHHDSACVSKLRWEMELLQFVWFKYRTSPDVFTIRKNKWGHRQLELWLLCWSTKCTSSRELIWVTCVTRMYLVNRYRTSSRQSFLLLLRRIRVRKVWVEIFIQYFGGLFAEITSPPPEISFSFIPILGEND